MKTLLTFLCLLLAQLAAFAQIGNRTYEIRSNIPAWPCGILGERLEGNEFCNDYCVPPYKARFAVVRYVDTGMVVIRFLDWKKNSQYYKQFNQSTNAIRRNNSNNTNTTAQLYFLIRRSDLDSNCIPVFGRGFKNAVFTVGLVTMPLKLRLGQNFDFQGSFTLGSTAGIKMRISEYNANYVNFLFGAAISTVALDSFSTRGRVSGQPLNNIATFSPSLGIVFEFGRAQAGVFYGWDFLSKSMQSKYAWIHNKKPWISVGFGFSIFNVNSQSANDEAKGQGTSSPANGSGGEGGAGGGSR